MRIMLHAKKRKNSMLKFFWITIFIESFYRKEKKRKNEFFG